MTQNTNTNSNSNTTPTQQAEAAMHRITEQINRSAGQHMRAVRKARAGQPVQPVSEGNTSAQRILRDVPLAAEQTAYSRPPHATAPVGRWPEATAEETEEAQAQEHESGMRMLAYALIALAVTALAVTASFLIAGAL